ncbi:MAG TPA: hypothetical protein VLT83_07385 [Opitutaceae bacterium]|nr:hypothetical protein [Opitutaceae bacterium]
MNPADHAIEEAHRAGFDVDLLDTNLALTPEERWRQHDAALELVLELEEARIARDAKLRPAAAETRRRRA